ncbi:MAG: STAS domain-containing protein [Anaerolineae bacterium]|jgi:anti-sigma B factor antagonist|nr:STAS domain-containing protein [Anaerolineae bacterium]
MVLNIEQLSSCTIVSLGGQLNGRVTSTIYDQVLMQVQAHAPQVVLDLSGVTYLSSAALRLLLSLYRAIDQRRGRMMLAGMSEEVWDILSITGFADLFETYRDTATALARLP